MTNAAPDLLMCFYGDDFTGSTDAMESLAIAGVRTVLFTHVPSPQELAKYPGLGAFGVAGQTRAMPPDEMEQTLRPAFAAIKSLHAPVVHYKVCSTFDSSPTVGSIGRAIDVGAEVFGTRPVPMVVGAPALGRYCVFGNLFARAGKDGDIVRLDRHPSMSRHPITPMDEADLRVHLAKQTSKSIGLIDTLTVARGEVDLAAVEDEVVLIDVLHENRLAIIGRSIDDHARSNKTPLFVVGSSGVEAALAAHWQLPPTRFAPVPSVEGLLVVCGSCSPVTARQMDRAASEGFLVVPFDASDAHETAAQGLQHGRGVIIHTRRATAGARPSDALATLTRTVIESAQPRRVLIAGGDTSGAIARALDIRSMEMIGELTRGAPLCRVTGAPGSPANGIEMCFKGGQIGRDDLFELVRRGRSDG